MVSSRVKHVFVFVLAVLSIGAQANTRFQTPGLSTCGNNFARAPFPSNSAGTFQTEALTQVRKFVSQKQGEAPSDESNTDYRFRYTRDYVPGAFGGRRRKVIIHTDVLVQRDQPSYRENLFRGHEQIIMELLGRENAFGLKFFGFENINGVERLVFYEPDTAELNGLAEVLKSVGYQVPMQFYDAPSAEIAPEPYSNILAFLGLHPKAFQGREGPHELTYHLGSWIYPPEVFGLAQAQARAVIAFNRYISGSSELYPLAGNARGSDLSIILDVFTGGMAYVHSQRDLQATLNSSQRFYLNVGTSAAWTTSFGVSPEQLIRFMISKTYEPERSNYLRQFESFLASWSESDPAVSVSLKDLYPNFPELNNFDPNALLSLHSRLHGDDVLSHPETAAIAEAYERIISEQRARFRQALARIRTLQF